MSRWKVTRTTYKVSDFISWQKSHTLVLNPNFQRRSVWNKGAKSYLIDSIIKGLPIPIIIIREQKSNLSSYEPKREIVDGQQRIRTLIAFIDRKILPDVAKNDDFSILSVHNKELANKKFSELPTEIQQDILDYEFSIHILPSKVDDREVLEIFARMNATGVKLNAQELRNAEYFGEFKTSAYNLATEQLYRWRNWLLFTNENISRMHEVEMTSELMLAMLKGVTAKKKSIIDKVYEQYDSVFQERFDIEKRFRFVMDSLEDFFEQDFLRFLPNKKTLFYALFYSIYKLLFEKDVSLSTNKNTKQVSKERINKIVFKINSIKTNELPHDVLIALTRRTTDMSSRKKLIDYLLSD
ncbi:MAG: DUF262 domain-containing protein [Patescibacteria group bacterium]